MNHEYSHHRVYENGRGELARTIGCSSSLSPDEISVVVRLFTAYGIAGGREKEGPVP